MNNINFWDYIKGAFNAKPAGMFVSPNWLGFGLFAIAGIMVNPGFLLLGTGLELFYLYLISTNTRFQKLIQSKNFLQKKIIKEERLQILLQKLPVSEKQKFESLRMVCYSILTFYSNSLDIDQSMIERHSENLDSLMWVFLHLLVSKRSILNIIPSDKTFASTKEKLNQMIVDLENKIASDKTTEEVKQTQIKKLDILKERYSTIEEASNKLAYIDEELDRITQQVELIREKAAISKDSQSLALQTDTIASIVNSASEWVKQQQNLFSNFSDINADVMPRSNNQKEIA